MPYALIMVPLCFSLHLICSRYILLYIVCIYSRINNLISSPLHSADLLSPWLSLPALLGVPKSFIIPHTILVSPAVVAMCHMFLLLILLFCAALFLYLSITSPLLLLIVPPLSIYLSCYWISLQCHEFSILLRTLDHVMQHVTPIHAFRNIWLCNISPDIVEYRRTL